MRIRVDVIPSDFIEDQLMVRFEIINNNTKIRIEKTYPPDIFRSMFDRIFEDIKWSIKKEIEEGEK